jgi:cardiolipin synthase A/B
MSLLRKDRWQSIENLDLLEGGKNYFSSLEESLAKAQKSIYLETYIFSADEQAQRIANLLSSAALRGLDVKVVIDWLGSSPFAFAKQFSEAGVQLTYYNPAWFGRFGFSRTHRKLVVVDELQAFVGGINICADHQTADGRHLSGLRWDLSLKATGKVVEKVHATFLRQWQRMQPSALHPRNILKRILDQELPWNTSHFLGTRHDQKASLAFIARDNLHHRRDIERAYLKAIGQSREEIWLATPYFMPGRRFRKALIRAAERGVAVNLLLGRDEFKVLNWSVPSLYGQFLAANITIYEYPLGLLHAKAMVVDRRWATLGSSNCDHLSFLLNHEANLVVRNHPVVKEIRWKIEDQALEKGIKIDSDLYSKRPFMIKVFNWLTYGLVRLLLVFLTVGTRDKAVPNLGD